MINIQVVDLEAFNGTTIQGSFSLNDSIPAVKYPHNMFKEELKKLVASDGKDIKLLLIRIKLKLKDWLILSF